ncbi:DUF4301 family protein [Leptobacterium flavescens]|nr:DUF4301 family protein [Leptobacterium flavescens]
MLDKRDLELLEKKGITEEKLYQQIETFKKGIPFVRLAASATVDNGICPCPKEQKDTYIELFDRSKDTLDLLKFVPASGAATRMFKSLFSFLSDFDPEKESLDSYIQREQASDIKTFFDRIENFPFYRQIKDKLTHSIDEDKGKHLFVKEMLDSDALNFGDYPKGLLPFHLYQGRMATAFEEHLREAAVYSTSGGNSTLHFTVSEAHKEQFQDEFKKLKEEVEAGTSVNFKVSFSCQKPSTDTVAVDPENNIFRQDDGSILFRPSGHGALIENLNEQDADIIFIKNIDNVVVKTYKDEVCDYKKVLAGKLLEVQKTAFRFAELLDREADIPGEELKKIREFVEDQLHVSLGDDFKDMEAGDRRAILQRVINRPIRICGMVKNEGEPGGGPFWITNKNGNTSLQIIESAQIDINDKEQKEILQGSTHFNPVDLVCGVRNYKGEKYNLLDFVDASQGFITDKTSQGRKLKALELPGLWNGAMARWNTLFVEVPLITFNPVKTVNDLLKPAHQMS